MSAIPYLEQTIRTGQRDACNRLIMAQRCYATNYGMIPNLLDNGLFDYESDPDYGWDMDAGATIEKTSAHDGLLGICLPKVVTTWSMTHSEEIYLQPWTRHRFRIWHRFHGPTAPPSAFVRLSFNTGPIQDFQLGVNVSGAWEATTIDIDNSQNAYDYCTFRLIVAASYNYRIDFDSLVLHPWAETFDLAATEFAYPTAGMTYRWTAPHCPVLRTPMLDYPVAMTRTEIGADWQRQTRSPKRSFSMTWPFLDNAYLDLFGQFYYDSLGQEITFGDWYGNEWTVRLLGPFDPQRNFDLGGQLTINLEQIGIDLRPEFTI